MITESSFQARARTVDHLGREQIADCPTAISELWKNAFDAYARTVELNILDGKEPVAAIVDDGHGMRREELLQKWLIVGTETKVLANDTTLPDRNGLKPRPRQGQKGIGRLSCANLGPILLLVSKRKEDSFVAALIDWRLFENPFVNLSDIHVPVTEFNECENLFSQMPNLVSVLSENVTGGKDKDRKDRLRNAWADYDQLQNTEGNQVSPAQTPSGLILSSISRVSFEPRHVKRWPVWTGQSEHGTALLISGINYDLRVHIDSSVRDAAADAAKERFFETLSSFVDPFVDPTDQAGSGNDLQFTYAARVWNGDAHRLIVGTDKQFDKRQVDDMEHRIDGQVDELGVFTGRVRAFGEWVGSDCVIKPPDDVTIPTRSDTLLGAFQIYIGSMEFTGGGANTTHSKAEFERYKALAAKYSGFMIFRDGLRVLPYGRADNDFFEIESRRTRSAGREFWNHRQMFGRVAITREGNPNLKDKAGREGLLDNRAAKTLKELVSNILKQSARQYFGSASELRKELLPQIKDDNRRKRAAEARARLRKRQRQEFSAKLRRFSRDLPEFAKSVEQYVDGLTVETENDIAKARIALDDFRQRTFDFVLPGEPKSLGALEARYADYRRQMRAVESALKMLHEELDRKIEEIRPSNPRASLEEQRKRQAGQIGRRVDTWNESINALQRAEYARIRDLVNQRKDLFHSEADGLLHRFDTGNLPYSEVSKLMDGLKQRIDEENADLFVPYIAALQNLQERIDLEHLATFGMEEIADLRIELERLNSLAQLGIAVEIVGHELQGYDDIIGSALNQLPKDVRDSSAVKDIEFGYEGLTDQLRFLSPLRLAGPKIQRWITGAEIADYVSEFFAVTLTKNRISMIATPGFRNLRVFDQRSRLYPVFINLINNSIYWLGLSDNVDRRIVLDLVGRDAVVSDNGPGVEPEDIDSLFSLFFTRKARGGRGVGLYLCRANLTGGGHRIRYEPDAADMPLSGANFVISFGGADFDGE